MAKGIKKAATPLTDDGWMTVPSAARELGVHIQTTLGYALDGKLTTQSVAGQRFISRASVDTLKKELGR